MQKLQVTLSKHPQRLVWWRDWTFLQGIIREKAKKLAWCRESDAWRDGKIGPFFKVWFVKQQHSRRDGVESGASRDGMINLFFLRVNHEFRLSLTWYMKREKVEKRF